MLLVVGLGNPGARYRGTRHNVGFLLVEALAARMNVTLSTETDLAESGSGRLAATDVVLAKPMTFMNQSGAAVAALRNAHAPHSIAVISDDLDLPARPDPLPRRRWGGGPSRRGVGDRCDRRRLRPRPDRCRPAAGRCGGGRLRPRSPGRRRAVGAGCGALASGRCDRDAGSGGARGGDARRQRGAGRVRQGRSKCG